MPCATPPSIKTLPDQRGHAEGPSCQRTGWLGPLGPFPPSFLARPVSLKLNTTCRQIKAFCPPTLGIFGTFFFVEGSAEEGPLVTPQRFRRHRGWLRYPSYTNFTDRRWGAGLLIQTNRSAAPYKDHARDISAIGGCPGTVGFIPTINFGRAPLYHPTRASRDAAAEDSGAVAHRCRFSTNRWCRGTSGWCGS